MDVGQSRAGHVSGSCVNYRGSGCGGHQLPNPALNFPQQHNLRTVPNTLVADRQLCKLRTQSEPIFLQCILDKIDRTLNEPAQIIPNGSKRNQILCERCRVDYQLAVRNSNVNNLVF
jgi:hypothetical protein